MRFTVALISFCLLSQSVAWAAPKKKPAVEEEGPQCLLHDDGSLDKTFFEDIKKIKRRLVSCDPAMTPGEMAFMYLKNLSNFTMDLQTRIDVTKFSFTSAKLAAGFKPDEMTKAIKNTGLIKEDDYVDEMLGIAEKFPGGKSVVKVLKWGKSNVIKKAKKEITNEYTTLEEQFKEVDKIRASLSTQTHKAKIDLDNVINAFDNPNSDTTKTLTDAQLELIRETTCRFMPKNSPNPKVEDKNMLFCSTVHGGEDLNDQRGSLSCKDVEALSTDNHEKAYQRVEAAFAKTVAKTVFMHDDSKLMSEGTTSRFTIDMEMKGSKGLGDPEMNFHSPGGVKLLCTMLHGPEFDKYWQDGKLKDNLLLKDTKLPINLHIHSSSYAGGVSMKYQYDQYGGMDRYKFNGRSDSSQAGQKWLNSFDQKVDVRTWPVTKLIKGKCNK